ncbi:hypothetical protein K1719_021799 [Acacia pycnantha]|nr:hypothetical protein K1719_021799 [Acacia pycnantha]
MNQELLETCKKEIQDLLDKKLIRRSQSPWSCAAFYVNKNAEIERGTPRLNMGRKKKPGDDQKNKQVLQEEEDKQSIFQDAQGPISEADLIEIIKQLLQQQQFAPQTQGAPSTSSNSPVSQTQGTRQTRSQSKSGSSTPKPESSTPTQSQTQGLISVKPGKKTIDSYVKKPPTEIWSEAITKKEYDSDKKEFALQLAQQKPPQASKPLAVTTVSANNPMDTPYIEKQNVVLNILQIEPEFFFETPNQLILDLSG